MGDRVRAELSQGQGQSTAGAERVGLQRGRGLQKVLTETLPPQVFYPKDSYSHPVQLDLLFRQVRASPP